MADILPFQGIRYDADRIGGDLAAVMAPPYDVISPDGQEALYGQHPQNVVRLILGKEPNRYSDAAETYTHWSSLGIVKPDAKPALYVYRQSFADPVTGAAAPDRIGIICLLKLEDYSTGKVLPHENTLTAAKSDRLNLLRATNAQFESIYGLYSDPSGVVASALESAGGVEIVIDLIDGPIGSSHQIERITDPAAIAAIVHALQDQPIFIADGHHRYETSLNYRREIREGIDAPDGSIAADYILITLTAFEDPGLLVLPTHRVVRNVSDERLSALSEHLSKHFSIEPISGTPELEKTLLDAEASGHKAIGLIDAGGVIKILRLRRTNEEIPDIIPGDQSDSAKRLDVTVLQRLILEDGLGIDASTLAAGTHVSYTRSIEEAKASIVQGQAQMAFILARPTVVEVRDVSLAGDKMPQKSTFFYPKLLSGLVMRDLRIDNIEELQEIAQG